MDKINELKELIKCSNNIVFFGGAGVSTESGIPDFRSDSGLYKKNLEYPLDYSMEEVLSHNFFMNNTKTFYDIYKNMLSLLDAKPNKAHEVLAKLESDGKLKGVVTQNIDGLHQKAGSENVCEIHGSVLKNYCMSCHKSYSVDVILKCDDIPKCEKCGGIIKPDVVLYGENLDNDVITKSINLIKNADMLIVGGTSLVVYPAASFIDYYNGDKLILINKSKTPKDNFARIKISHSIGEVLEKATT